VVYIVKIDAISFVSSKKNLDLTHKCNILEV